MSRYAINNRGGRRMHTGRGICAVAVLCIGGVIVAEDEWWKPYSPPCTERENVFEFTEKPKVRMVGPDRYEITFAVKGYCDVTVAIIDPDPKKELVPGRGIVVRHLGAGVLGPNAPSPFQKNSLKQTLYWDGKDDLGEYHKEPEKLKVRVSLGLKPEFDKRLGGTSGKNLPGYICGIACGPDGAYVIAKGPGAKGHATIRHFDRDGNYVKTLTPPPANIPESKLNGLGYVEYELGKRAVHGPLAYQTIADRGNYLVALGGGRIGDVQPALSENRLYFASSGYGEDCAHLHYIYTDGSTDVAGMKGFPLVSSYQRHPKFAASPDGRWLYMSGVASTGQGGDEIAAPVIMRKAISGATSNFAEPFIGKWVQLKKGHYDFQPGSDNQSLNGPRGLDCDGQGRIYVADSNNNRIQIFTSDGKYWKTIAVNKPKLVQVHQKTGAVYVIHSARVQGRSLDRLTKFHSAEEPLEEFHVDEFGAAVFALDSWSPKPRLWVAGTKNWVDTAGAWGEGPGLRVFEEDGGKLRKIADFDEEAKAEAGVSWFGKWSGAGVMHSAIVCDPVREQAYFERQYIFDLRSGRYLGRFAINMRVFDDIAFDKHGYMHVHFNPGFEVPGVGRVDPGRATAGTAPDTKFYPEVPYDYGVEIAHRGGWKGVLPVKDQPGAKYFQDGLGVNMRGDIAVESNIYYVPKMEDIVMDTINAGAIARRSGGVADAVGFTSTGGISYEDFIRKIHEQEKRGEQVYFIKRVPGVPLFGGTIWTYDRTGELRAECAVIAGKLIEGPLIDEDGKLYFINSRTRLKNGKPFLTGRGGTFGDPEDTTNKDPFTGTFMKTAEKNVRVLLKNAEVPLDTLPDRPPELAGGYGESPEAWVEGAEWLYAGASPVVSGGCSCPVPRAHLDWFKRSFVPEAYRHSFAVLDTNGNLIMHLGRYGNFDSGNGPNSKIPIGGDNIAVFIPRFISGTDNYLCFYDWGERLAVLKINYHAEEEVSVVTK